MRKILLGIILLIICPIMKAQQTPHNQYPINCPAGFPIALDSIMYNDTSLNKHVPLCYDKTTGHFKNTPDFLIDISGIGLTEVLVNGDGTVFNNWTDEIVGTVETLTGHLKSIPAGYALMGPQIAVPGTAAVIQSKMILVSNSGSDVTNASITFDNPNQQHNAIIFAESCNGYNVNTPTPSITDTNSNSYTNFSSSGHNSQISAYDIPAGLNTLNVTFSYGVGVHCPNMIASIIEVSNLNGLTDGQGAGALLLTNGNYDATFTNTTVKDFVLFNSSVDNTLPVTIVSHTSNISGITIDQRISDITVGSGFLAHFAANTVDTYTITNHSPGNNSESLAVAYKTGGTFNTVAPWVGRYISLTDLPQEVQDLVANTGSIDLSNYNTTIGIGLHDNSTTGQSFDTQGNISFTADNGSGAGDFSVIGGNGGEILAKGGDGLSLFASGAGGLNFNSAFFDGVNTGTGATTFTSAGSFIVTDSSSGEGQGIAFTEQGSAGIRFTNSNSSGTFDIINTGGQILLQNFGGDITLTGTGGINLVDNSTHGITFLSNSSGNIDFSLLGSGGITVNGAAPSGHYLRGNGTTYVDSVIALADLPIGAAFPVSFTSTGATSDNLTVTGMTASGHCTFAPTNASAATNIATTYISAKTTDQITITHTATSGMDYDFICSAN